MLKNILLVIVLFISTILHAQNWNSDYHKGQAAFQQKSYKNAISYLTKARFYAEKEFGKDHKNYFNTIRLLAESYEFIQDYEGSISLYLSLLRSYKDIEETGTLEYGQLNITIGLLYKKKVRYKSAANYVKEGITVIKKTKGEKSIEYVRAFMIYIDLCMTTGLHAKAETYIDQIEPIAKSILGTKDSEYIKLLSEKAEIYKERKKYKGAVEILNHYITLSKVAKKSKKDYNEAYASLCFLYRKLKNREKVLENYRIYLRNQKAIYGQTSSDYIKSIGDAIVVFEKDSLPNAAIMFIKERLDLEYSAGSKDYNNIIGLLIDLSEQYKKLEQFDVALEKISEAQKVATTQQGIDDVKYIASFNALSDYYMAKHDVDRTIESLKKTFETIKTKYPKKHPTYGEYLLKISKYHLDNEKIDDAKMYAENVKTIYEKINKKTHYIYGNSLSILAKIAIKNKELEIAKAYVKQIGVTYNAYYGSATKQYVDALEWLGDITLEMGNNSEARRIYSQVLILSGRVYGPSSKNYKRAAEKVKTSKK